MSRVSEFIARYPWAARFVAPVLALLAARGIVLEVTDLDVIFDLGVEAITAGLALWRYLATQRRSIPTDGDGAVVLPLRGPTLPTNERGDVVLPARRAA